MSQSPVIDHGSRRGDILSRMVQAIAILRATKSIGQRYLRLTYVSKRDFHNRLGPDGDAPLFVRQGWPANHYGESSRAWNAEHRYEQSSMWPPNHLLEASTTLTEPALGSLRNPSGEVVVAEPKNPE